MKKIIFILGPTASGKTALAVKLAKKFSAKSGPAFGWNGAEIISADSRQIYIGLDIGSGKDLDEYNGVKYHLIDICTPEEKFTLFDWLKIAKETLDEIWKRKKVPIVVGGTALYAKALAEGYSIQSSKFKNPKSRFNREELNKMSLENLQEIFSKLKIENEKCKIDLKNPRRLIRAIERSQEGTRVTKKKPHFESIILAIDMARDDLYRRIDQRIDQRFEKQGMLEEVQGLLDSGVDAGWLVSLGLEYRIISIFLLAKKLGLENLQIQKLIKDNKFNNDNFKDFDSMKQLLKYRSHAYARRQITFLRKQKDLIWIKNAREAEELVAGFLKKEN